MKPPVEPNKEDCCNSGCNPCVFDVYENQLRLYQKYVLSGESQSSDNIENAILQLEYTPFILEKNELLCESHVLLTFKRIKADETDLRKVFWKPGDHFLVKYNSDEGTCTRAYTPLKLQKCADINGFSIILKIYNSGTVSNFLGNLKIGDKTLWRGPYGTYEIIPNKHKRIIMIAQGTGIAPFFSIIDNILENEDDMTKLFLYFCVKNANVILFRDELYSYKQYWNFSYKIFLSAVSEINCKYQEPIINHRLGLEDFSEVKPFSSDDQILICGSSHFMDYFKKILKTETLENVLLF